MIEVKLEMTKSKNLEHLQRVCQTKDDAVSKGNKYIINYN